MNFLKNKLLFPILILIVVISGGFFCVSSFFISKLSEYDMRIIGLSGRISQINSTINNLKVEIFKTLDQIGIDKKIISDLESRISNLIAHVGVFYGNITVYQTKNLIESNISLVILDVRTISEYNDGHIDGARNIPVDELESRLQELNQEDEILVYCRLGVRSNRARGILNAHNFTKVYNMLGGIEAWKQAGYLIAS